MDRSNLKILVIDDDERVRSFISRVLLDEGHVPLMAKDGCEALRVLENETPSLIFLDLNMPVMGGVEFIDRFDNAGQIPIVIFSATQPPAPSLPGVVGMLPKPFSIAQMRESISRTVVRQA